MNRVRNCIAFVVIALVGAACATATKTPPASKTFSEDLSAYRPEFDTASLAIAEAKGGFRKTKSNINPNKDVTVLVNSKLDSLAENNAEIRYVNGYSIQIYSGSSSDEAYQARDTARQILPEIRTNVEYQQPVYKVRVGGFTERLEVQRTLLTLKPHFPSAISVPVKIKVN